MSEGASTLFSSEILVKQGAETNKNETLIVRDDLQSGKHLVATGGSWSIALDANVLADGDVFEVGYERRISILGNYYPLTSSLKEVIFDSQLNINNYDQFATLIQDKLRGIYGNQVSVTANEDSLDIDGFVKILADAETDEVIGAHMIGPRVADMISEIAVAMEFRASAEDIARMSHAHPTYAEAIKEAALAATADRALHI